MTRLAGSAFSGEGARLLGGHGNRKGLLVAYTAEFPPLPLLEMTVQDDPLRAQYLLVPALVSPLVSFSKLEAAELGHNWHALSARDGLQALGHDWQQGRKACILSVPSVLQSAKQNFITDPLHPDYSKITIG